jgi:hypothetical protein
MSECHIWPVDVSFMSPAIKQFLEDYASCFDKRLLVREGWNASVKSTVKPQFCVTT